MIAPRSFHPASIQVFAPPYEFLSTLQRKAGQKEVPRGVFWIWYPRNAETQANELQLLLGRPLSIPLVVVLPSVEEIHRALPLLTRVEELRPRAVLPSDSLAKPRFLRQLLSRPPSDLARAVVEHLFCRGLLAEDDDAAIVSRIFELAPEVQTISRLSRRLYMSRRTLGRHFQNSRLPTPSHWLQFARVLYVATRLQGGSDSVNRLAAAARYPDGFTLSNQMKRLIGVRPTIVRQCLGWEWIVEAWVAREGRQLSRNLST